MSNVINPTNNDVSLYADANDDFAGMRQRDLVMPNLRLMQALSPMVGEEMAKAGDFCDTSTKSVVIPRDSKKFVVPLIFWLEWIEWNPKRNVPKEEKILARSNDPSSEVCKIAERWETVLVNGKEKPRVTEYYNFIVCMENEVDGVADYSQMFVVNFSKTGHRTGKMWLNKLRNSKIRLDDAVVSAPIWYNKWELYTIQESKDGDKFYTPQIGSSKQVDPSHHSELKTLNVMMKERRAELMRKFSNEAEASEAGPVAPATGGKGDEPPF